MSVRNNIIDIISVFPSVITVKRVPKNCSSLISCYRKTVTTVNLSASYARRSQILVYHTKIYRGIEMLNQATVFENAKIVKNG